MATTQLSFHRVSSTPTTGMIPGTIYFNTSKNIIEVATTATTTEAYGLVRNATWENNILTIWKSSDTDASPSIKLDFSDVASATDMSKLLGRLRNDINSLQGEVTNLTTTVNKHTESIKSNADAIKALQNATGGESGLGKRVTNLENTVGDSTKGLVKKVNDIDTVVSGHTTSIANLTSGKANKNGSTAEKFNVATPTEASNATTKKYVDDAISGAVTSTYKVKGSKATKADLPKTGNVVGDVWNVVAADGKPGDVGYTPAGTNYVWVGAVGEVAAHWDPLGGTVDLTGYATTSDLSEVSNRVDVIENSYVKTVKASVTKATGTTNPHISVTPTNATKGEVTITIDETVLDQTVSAIQGDITQLKKDVSAAAQSGVTKFGGETGEIVIDTAASDAMTVKFAMKNKKLTATVNPYKSKGTSETPVYIASDGTPTAITKDTVVTAKSNKLVTSGAVDTRITTEVSTINNTISNLNSLKWAEWPA